MMKVIRIFDNIWKFTGTDNVNVYFIDLEDDKIMIDTGYRSDRQDLVRLLGNLTDLSSITKVIFTHLHYDHTGNFDLFPNAEFFASKREIRDFQKDSHDSMLDDDLIGKFRIKLNPLGEKLGPLEVIETPGHTAGSVCLWYPEKSILFTGDTMFAKKQLGRTDLPTSSPSEMNDSLIRLLDYNFKILAPGHDY